MAEKPTFKTGPQPAEASSDDKPKRPKRKELAVVWEKETKDGEKYLNIKVIGQNGDDVWLKAFKNRMKKDGETTKPDFVAFERPENA